ncbi:uncharacterized protein B0T15DRAFT_502322 [Chaetomium strumarium]|uniref:Uncharacterized protein n=1 Tax=Chaetomium strumarium TaxID=1170767 RepID=A0AAJ0GS90_9PEZI|nr:hypothetical protein B0T15DRAFT_502322 [Chaetomium strumarium]
MAAGISMSKTAESSRESSADWLGLMNVIPARLRNSLVLGTVAYDFYNEDSYEMTNPGVYAIGIAIKGRKGEFLTVAGIEKVSQCMVDYCQVWKTWEARSGDWSQMTVPERQYMAHAAAVDSVYRGVNKDMTPRFVGGPAIYEKTMMYISWLQKRAERGQAFDETKAVSQRQSPIYVGCTGESIASASAHHDPKGGLCNSSPLLALTLRCIKHEFPNLEPEVIAKCVVPAWRAEHVPLGDHLVTILASSMFYQGRLNIDQPGDGIEAELAKLKEFAERDLYTEYRVAFEKEVEKFQALKKQYDEANEWLYVVRDARRALQAYNAEVAGSRNVEVLRSPDISSFAEEEQ